MNHTIETMLQHRSIRHFTEQKIEAEKLALILRCANAASSSSFIQCSSIIRVTLPSVRAKLAELAGGQAYVESAAEFLVFCADYKRHQQIYSDAQLGFTEQTLIGAVDTGLMGQNAMLAAESMGLGGVYIGGIRNDPEQVTELLALPKHVLPLFGMCLGYPAKIPQPKPRLPLSIVVHQERYQSLDKAELENYDQHIRAYYGSRSSNNKQTSWSDQIRATLNKESRPFMQAYLNGQGFSTK
ncbi:MULTISPECIES: oxygen-insensitive NADPH nitroreductase [unclassified Shewanella]|uniref:oxygen-insensitive NADPH nitroreductase n=1 Tax=unclassified Shewanella TaxID=196818 RepID=UPI001BC1E529|nr:MULTISPECIES: oxygen-insensitive NADPH nitroreductase [unclassified Shewanella]GIU09594.1 NADPH-dependent oxidoreductase [Shewanella sp. MBTL60-112-B1]GIU34085.1 NADPH-dependent oxidoreductase [Shewanella sp. MBTL60-112-B2]